MQDNTIKINDEFQEIDTRTIDNRNRLTIGELAQGFNRVRLYKNKTGEILLKPVVEIPVSDLWLFQNKEAFENVQKGLKDKSVGELKTIKKSGNLKDIIGKWKNFREIEDFIEESFNARVKDKGRNVSF